MFDHSEIFIKEPWYPTMSPHDWCQQVGVGKVDSDDYYRIIENLSSRVGNL